METNTQRDSDFRTMPHQMDSKYRYAYKRMKRIKGFYIHLLVYILVNSVGILANTNKYLKDSNEFWSWETFATPLCWGIGLLAHGVAVFGRNIFFSADWEEKKIQQLVQKETRNKWE